MQRVNDILLGSLERPALAWLCRIMPGWVSPDIMTFLGIAGGLMTLVGYGFSHWHPGFLGMACAGLVINWLGDSLDGTLARHRGIERPKYGFFLDHMTDAYVTMLVCIGLGLTPFVGMPFALVALIGYLSMSILTYVSSLVNGVFRISYGKLGPTEIRILLIVVSIAMPFLPNPVLLPSTIAVHLFDAVVLLAGVLLILTSLITTLRTLRTLAVGDPPRRPSSGPTIPTGGESRG
jgi:archaetidylinositol phosphate synthase